ncbi:MAG: hypothetical protein U9N81_08805 [Bacillota bacterium]|nr:hypothetical protein [Bacillota bacterium]
MDNPTMHSGNVNVQTPGEAMVAKAQRTLGLLAWCQVILGLLLLFAPLWLGRTALTDLFPIMAAAALFIALGYGAYLARNDLGSAKVILSTTLAAQWGVTIITLIFIFSLGLATAYSVLLAVITFILGLIPLLALNKAKEVA